MNFDIKITTDFRSSPLFFTFYVYPFPFWSPWSSLFMHYLTLDSFYYYTNINAWVIVFLSF